jgi:hypothetical protein
MHLGPVLAKTAPNCLHRGGEAGRHHLLLCLSRQTGASQIEPDVHTACAIAAWLLWHALHTL